MAFSLGTIIYVALLLTNAIAILSEERFLAKIGWSTYSAQQIASSSNAGFGSVPSYNNDPNAGSAGVVGGASGEGQGVKARLINLIAAVRTLLRIPLIALNIVVIAYEIVLG
ncbi:hypothetical protein FFLO_01674 [Filobasidium floriforme]|uniref:Yos1-like protein n=1 Tax=Filobasidium floriforme TaxID=5210 RepID=A0A8K0JP27_9TREE|nr:Yos1-like protein [Filobasidium floriforme]KAG7562845.1 hypothetical protein FFLO_01674 [Filobasidium floriforme]KAH8086469.1 Yos1-like protein [Filobasidium floriforme]